VRRQLLTDRPTTGSPENLQGTHNYVMYRPTDHTVVYLLCRSTCTAARRRLYAAPAAIVPVPQACLPVVLHSLQ